MRLIGSAGANEQTLHLPYCDAVFQLLRKPFRIGVRIERFHPSNSLAGPAARYHISPREVEVLALLLEGAKLEEIGEALSITTSTVQDHIKSMVDKTESRNRTELIARVLGWENAPETP